MNNSTDLVIFLIFGSECVYFLSCNVLRRVRNETFSLCIPQTPDTSYSCLKVSGQNKIGKKTIHNLEVF